MKGMPLLLIIKKVLKLKCLQVLLMSLKQLLKNGVKPENISTCHNFYPERYTAPSLEAINDINNYWKAKNKSKY